MIFCLKNRIASAIQMAVITKTQKNTTNSLLKAKAGNEVEWINRVDSHHNGKFAVIAWSADQIKGEKLLEL